MRDGYGLLTEPKVLKSLGMTIWRDELAMRHQKVRAAVEESYPGVYVRSIQESAWTTYERRERGRGELSEWPPVFVPYRGALEFTVEALPEPPRASASPYVGPPGVTLYLQLDADGVLRVVDEKTVIVTR